MDVDEEVDRGHPYLEGVAAFQALVEGAAAGAAAARARARRGTRTPRTSRRACRSCGARAGLDVAPEGAVALRAIAARVARAELPPPSPGRRRASTTRSSVAAGRGPRSRGWCAGRRRRAQPEGVGLMRYLGWTALAARLAPIVAEFAALARRGALAPGECPTCGSAPTMGSSSRWRRAWPASSRAAAAGRAGPTSAHRVPVLRQRGRDPARRARARGGARPPARRVRGVQRAT